MAKALGMQGAHPAAVLDELDAWQELRTNFIVCFVRKDAPPGAALAPFANKHPLFDLRNRAAGWRHRARLLRLAWSGVSVSSRTHAQPLPLHPGEIRALLGARAERLSGDAREILPRLCSRASLAAPPSGETPSQDPLPVRAGTQAPNPLYAHLFEAWSRAPLAQQIARWQPHADPLEDELCPFGLTPFGTVQGKREEAERGLEASREAPFSSFKEIRFKDESGKKSELRSFLQRFPQLPAAAWEENWRELWILLFSFPHLVLPIHKEKDS